MGRYGYRDLRAAGRESVFAVRRMVTASLIRRNSTYVESFHRLARNGALGLWDVTCSCDQRAFRWRVVGMPQASCAKESTSFARQYCCGSISLPCICQPWELNYGRSLMHFIPQIAVLVSGHNCAAVAESAAKIIGITKVCLRNARAGTRKELCELLSRSCKLP